MARVAVPTPGAILILVQRMLVGYFAVLLTFTGFSLFGIALVRNFQLDGYRVLRKVEQSDYTREQSSLEISYPGSNQVQRISYDRFANLMTADPFWYSDASGVKIELGHKYRARELGFCGVWLLGLSLCFWGVLAKRRSRMPSSPRPEA